MQEAEVSLRVALYYKTTDKKRGEVVLCIC